jgi:hypothetical protein
MGGACSTKGGKRNAYRLLVGKPGGRRPLGRPKRRWLDNIRMDLFEMGWGDMDWIGLAQDRDRWRALPWNAGKLSSVLTTGDLSSSAQLHGASYLVISIRIAYKSTWGGGAKLGKNRLRRLIYKFVSTFSGSRKEKALAVSMSASMFYSSFHPMIHLTKPDYILCVFMWD